VITHTLFLPIIFATSIVVTSLEVGKGASIPWQLNEFGPAVDELNASMYYNWHYRPTPGVVNTDHWPMAWCLPTARHLINHPEYLTDTKVLLLFNEPDAGDLQCQATPEEAAQVTLELQQTFPHIQYWISPAIHCDWENISGNCAYDDWMRDYLVACEGCQIDALAGHHYDWWPCSTAKMLRHLERFKAYGFDVIISEYGCITDDRWLQVDRYNEWTEIFRNDPRVVAWMPWTTYSSGFGDFDKCSFIEPTGLDDASYRLTPLGEWYQLN
jgi:hypothetical protein